MAKAFTFELRGVKRLLKTIKTQPQELQDRVAFELEDFSRKVNAEQVKLTPVNLGDLRRGNDLRGEKDGLKWTIFNTKDYSPYVEFGTGAMVKVPAGLEDYAMQFKGKGIKEVNLPPRPFFFEPFFKNRKELITNIKKALKK